MDKTNPTEKFEIIEQALQESIGGGLQQNPDWCGIKCSIFSRDICDINFCGSKDPQ